MQFTKLGNVLANYIVNSMADHGECTQGAGDEHKHLGSSNPDIFSEWGGNVECTFGLFLFFFLAIFGAIHF